MRLSIWMTLFELVHDTLSATNRMCNILTILPQLTQEFQFPVAAFHHAHEAYLVPDVLKKAYGQISNTSVTIAEN